MFFGIFGILVMLPVMFVGFEKMVFVWILVFAASLSSIITSALYFFGDKRLSNSVVIRDSYMTKVQGNKLLSIDFKDVKKIEVKYGGLFHDRGVAIKTRLGSDLLVGYEPFEEFIEGLRHGCASAKFAIKSAPWYSKTWFRWPIVVISFAAVLIISGILFSILLQFEYGIWVLLAFNLLSVKLKDWKSPWKEIK